MHKNGKKRIRNYAAWWCVGSQQLLEKRKRKNFLPRKFFIKCFSVGRKKKEKKVAER